MALLVEVPAAATHQSGTAVMTEYNEDAHQPPPPSRTLLIGKPPCQQARQAPVRACWARATVRSAAGRKPHYFKCFRYASGGQLQRLIRVSNLVLSKQNTTSRSYAASDSTDIQIRSRKTRSARLHKYTPIRSELYITIRRLLSAQLVFQQGSANGFLPALLHDYHDRLHQRRTTLPQEACLS
jgi:hypothetical protein